MAKERPVKTGHWALTRHEYSVVRRYALLYGDWLDQYNALKDSVGAIVTDGMPHGNTVGNPTQSLAMKRAELSKKMELIEVTAKQAAPEIWPWLLKAVAEADCSYQKLLKPKEKDVRPIPCGKNVFYEQRRKFYWLLAQKIL